MKNHLIRLLILLLFVTQGLVAEEKTEAIQDETVASEEEKETFSYNTSVYKLLKEQDNDEDKIYNDWVKGEDITEEDDWSNFPDCKDASQYEL